MAFKNNSLGVSATDINTIDPNLGILNTLSGSAAAGQQAMDFANQLYPQVSEADPWEAAFYFFSEMGRQASVPGATAFGSFLSSTQAPMDYLNAKKKENTETKRARLQTAVQIAPGLKPKPTAGKVTYRPATAEELKQYGAVSGQMSSDGKFYDLSKTTSGGGSALTTFGIVDSPNDTIGTNLLAIETILGRKVNLDGNNNAVLSKDESEALNAQGFLLPKQSADSKVTTKSLGQGSLAEYMSAEDAKAFVIAQGLSEDSPNFNRTVEDLTAVNDDQIGKSIIQNGVFLELFPIYQNEDLVNFQLSPTKSPVIPYFTTYTQKRLPLLAKSADTYNSQAVEVLPRVDEALALLKTGEVTTGLLDQKMLPYKQVFNQMFGINDPQITNILTLQATSNFMAPKMRPVGSGSTSDMEFKAYQKAALFIGNTPEANYISLYAFKKMAENAIELNIKERELLTSNDYSDLTAVNNELKRGDSGIFEKYTGSTEGPDAQADFEIWYNSLEDGAVIINNGLFNVNDSYVIKGWGS